MKPKNKKKEELEALKKDLADARNLIVSQFKGIQIQMLRVQEELLKGQLMLIGQFIQALEAAPEAPSAASSAAETQTNGKIIVT